MLSPATKATIVSWLQTLSPPKNIAGNQEAARLEVDLLVGVFDRASVTKDEVPEVFRVVKETAETRSWPTSKELIAAIARVRGSSSEQDPKRGDRSKLSHDQLVLLDNKILPTARRWLGTSLDEHGRKTLEYWGEQA